MAQPSSKNRLAHIDCLRAIAALAVMMHHSYSEIVQVCGIQGPISDAIIHVLYDYIDLGRFGVLLFFIISGYCIANSILRPSPHPVTTFAVNRVARIYPAYLLSIPAAVAVLGMPQTYDLITNIFLINGFVGRPGLIGVYWTLTFELSFYGLCIFLFLCGIFADLKRMQYVWLGLLTFTVGAALARGIADLAIPYALPWFWSLMVGGSILRRMDDANTPSRGLIAAGFLAMLAGALVIAFNIYDNPGMYNKGWYRDFTSNAAAILVFAIGNYVIKLRSAALSFVGRISYSLYLFHALVIVELVDRLLLGPLGGTGIPGAMLMGLIVIVATLVLTSAIYYWVELPGMRVGRRLGDILAKRAAVLSFRLP